MPPRRYDLPHGWTRGVFLGTCCNCPLSATLSGTTNEPPAELGSGPDAVTAAAGELLSPVRIALDKKRALCVSDFIGKAVVEFETSDSGLESAKTSNSFE
ncbi:MAG: hypothetical protein GTO22_17330 [Gemmatimonadales bacterium]|nr:hypothetical protein [Gemmatimonadales bacterium]